MKEFVRRKFIWIPLVVLVLGAGYFGYKTLRAQESTPQYVSVPVEKGTLTVSVNASGQVAASNQVDIKPQAAGKVISIHAGAGQEVQVNAILAQLDSSEAQRSVRDAQTNVENARLALEKLQQPSDPFTILQARNSLEQAQDNLAKLQLDQNIDYQSLLDAKKKAEDNLIKGYEDTFNTIADAFLDLPTIASNLDDVLHGSTIGDSEPLVGSGQWNETGLYDTTDSEFKPSLKGFQDNADNDYATARAKYDHAFETYKHITRYSDAAVIESLLGEVLDTTKSLAQAAKSESNFLDAWVDFRTQRDRQIFQTVKDYQKSLADTIGNINNHLSSLLAIQRTLQDIKEAKLKAENDIKKIEQNNPFDLRAAQQSVKEKEASLGKLQAGQDPLDIQTQRLTLRQRQNALADVVSKLADYTIRAPFDGIVAIMNFKVGDTVSSGTIGATMITKQKLADVSLNEVDVAKVRVGQKVSLTFDAIEELSISGQVAAIDTLGTATQGVVNYNVKIAFDTQDERIKPGMSVSAAIIIDVRQDVLLVPSSAVKSQADISYVEVLENGMPQRHIIEAGLSDDTMTEISGDIKERDEVVTQTITQSATQSGAQSTNRPATTGILGVGGGGLRTFNVGGGR